MITELSQSLFPFWFTVNIEQAVAFGLVADNAEWRDGVSKLWRNFQGLRRYYLNLERQQRAEMGGSYQTRFAPSSLAPLIEQQQLCGEKHRRRRPAAVSDAFAA